MFNWDLNLIEVCATQSWESRLENCDSINRFSTATIMCLSHIRTWNSMNFSSCYFYLKYIVFSLIAIKRKTNAFNNTLSELFQIANSSWHWGSYGSIWTGPSPKQYYMDRRFWGPYNIFLVTDRSIYCHMVRSDMNYLLYYTFYLK